MQVRPADAAEINHLAQLWHDVWHETHAPLHPPELTRLRTLESFRERLQAALPNVRVAGPLGAPVGFCVLKGEELYQLFVSPETRGSGVAAAGRSDPAGAPAPPQRSRCSRRRRPFENPIGSLLGTSARAGSLQMERPNPPSNVAAEA